MMEGMSILGVDEYEVGLMFHPENDNNYKLINGTGQFSDNIETIFSFKCYIWRRIIFDLFF